LKSNCQPYLLQCGKKTWKEKSVEIDSIFFFQNLLDEPQLINLKTINETSGMTVERKLEPRREQRLESGHCQVKSMFVWIHTKS